MLHVEIITSFLGCPLKEYSEYTFKCEFCFKKITFYTLSPIMCEHCKRILPEIMDLIDDVKCRIEYHFTPEIKKNI